MPPAAPPSPPRAWAEIDFDALRHNLGVARHASGQKIMAVVKAGAYGHGLESLAACLEAEGVAFLGVANVGEARRLAAAKLRTPVYLLGPTFPEEREEVVCHRWVPCLSTLDEAHHFSELATAHGTTLQAHLTLDTGMGRGGFLPEDAPGILPRLLDLPGLQLTGLGSHLPSADEDPEFTRQQFARFDRSAGELLPRFRLPPAQLHVHLANSAGLLAYQSSTTNLVRPGLMLYGVSPLPEFQEQLRAVMTLKLC